MKTMLVGAVAAAAISVSPAGADHECVPGARAFAYCGEHPRIASLPLAFALNVGSRPPNLSTDDVAAALNGAVDEWNRHWPLPTGTLACPALCTAGTTSRHGVHLHDGENTVSWSRNTGPCGNGHGGIAVACVRYNGAGTRILEVDIVLNPDLPWYQPRITGGAPADALRVAAGEVAGAYPELGDSDTFDVIGDGQGKYDVQSVLTHELGHALGLLDIGSMSDPWPRTLTDSDRYQQTMYRWYHRGTTNKRTLHDGDIAGLQWLALDVVVDG